MKEIGLGIAIIIFIISIVCVWLVLRRNFSKKIVGKDINKKGEPLVAESVGLSLIAPFWFLIIIFNLFFLFSWQLILVGVAVSVFAFIGFLDDNKNKFLSKAIGWKVRALPIAIVALLTAGVLFVPADLFGLFWLMLLALFFAGLASLSNTFEGLNGWTIGSSFIIAITLAIVSIKLGYSYSFLFLGLAAIVLGLLVFNRFPARAFPGDSGTLLIGSAIAGLVLFTQNILFVIFAFLLFLPHMVDFFLLKMVTNRDDASQHKMRPYTVLKNGKLSIPDYKGKNKYDFAKLIMKIFGPLNEWQIVIIIWIIVIINSSIWASVFYNLL